MFVVTGGAGFIGSHLIETLNEHGISDILVSDSLQDGRKCLNLAQCRISDYMEREDFEQRLLAGKLGPERIEAIFHLGACTDTTEWNGTYLMEVNYRSSRILLDYAVQRSIPFYYASSASIYGNGKIFKESLEYEKPINAYGYSKYLFDQVVRAHLPLARAPLVGLRYFNVYGTRESHKGAMASVFHHFYHQLKTLGCVQLFGGSDGYADGEQRRDFIWVKDVVNTHLWFLKHEAPSGIYNLGTGNSRSFNELADALIDWYGSGKVDYVPMPEHLRGRYQSYTQADTTLLRQAGYHQPFADIESGLKATLGNDSELIL